ncbi:MAG: hypothetical protein AB2689_08620 [Candidatus Thiodiazotropha taylori]
MTSLDDLAKYYGTDKSSEHHDYMRIYESYLAEYKLKNFHLIELGVGGRTYNGPCGASLKTWKAFFQNARFSGVDSDPVCKEAEIENTQIYIGNQDDPFIADSVIATYGAPSIIVDDASHNNEKTIATFGLYFQLLEPGGFYFIEDTHCSYENKFENKREDFNQFLLSLASSIDQNGQKLTPHNAQAFTKIPNYDELPLKERWVEYYAYHRGLLVIRKRSI